MAAGPVVHQVDYCRAVSKTGHVVHWVAGVIGHLLPEADEPVSAKATVRLIKALGCDGISKSQVSRICQDWTRWWRTSLADAWTATLTPMCDWALTQKVREDGRIVNVSVVATGVSAVGQLEVLGRDVGTSDDGAFRLSSLRSLNALVSAGWNWSSPTPTRV